MVESLLSTRKSAQVISVWSVLAVVNGVAFALPNSRFFGFSSAVLMAAVAVLNVMMFFLFGRARVIATKRDVAWITFFLLLAFYLVFRTGLAFAFVEPTQVGSFDIYSAATIWRGNVSWLFYTGSLWLVLYAAHSHFSLRTFTRTWFIANMMYWMWTLIFGFQTSLFQSFDIHLVGMRFTLLGYEPSYTGPMLIIMAMLLLAQHPLRRIDLVILLWCLIVFFGVFSKGAIVALILGAVVTMSLNARLLIRAATHHYIITTMLVTTVVISVVLAFRGQLESGFTENVITPLLLGPEGALRYAKLGIAGTSTFATRYMAMVDALSALWPWHLFFGFGDGIYRFAIAHAAIQNGVFSTELSGYLSNDLGAFTAKSDALNLVLEGGVVAFIGAVALMVRSFRFPRVDSDLVTMRSERCFLLVFMAVALILTERLPYWSLLLLVNFAYGRLGAR